MPTTTHVTGGTGVGTDTANAGFGVLVHDGSIVRVRDDDTLVTGALGDLKVGTLPPRSLSAVAGAGWTDFRTNNPIKNEYDLTTPFAVNAASGLSTPPGDEVAGAGSGGRSGSRLYQRP